MMKNNFKTSLLRAMYMLLSFACLMSAAGCGEPVDYTEPGSRDDYYEAVGEQNEVEVIHYEIGDALEFGTYEQDDNLANGAEPILWRVLAVEDDRMLVISERVLDNVAYNAEERAVTWENCDLRDWLNGDFLDTAFTAEEQSRILLTKLTTADNTKHDTDGGVNTNDYVFCLSAEEAKGYMRSDTDRKVFPTDYAVTNGVYVCNGYIEEEYEPSSTGCCAWWLRTPGVSNYRVSVIYFRGELYDLGEYTFNTLVGVRPAMYISI